MTEELPSVLLLAVMAVVALWLTISRGGVAASAAAVRPAVRVAAIAIAAQAGHFVEEVMTGFHIRLPAVFGLAPLSLRLFVSFNLAWLGIWALSVWGLARRRQVALFPLWFLGVASVTSPLMAAVGALLLARLSRVTA